MSDWADVGRALLGSWPSHVAGWGREAIAAYLEELEQRGVTPDAALVAIRTAEGSFPPSAPDLARLAHTDPDAPVAVDLLGLLYERGGVMRTRVPRGDFASEAQMLSARDEARLDRAYEIHPLLGAFVEAYGARALAMLDVDGEFGAIRRRELEESWQAFAERNAHRDRAALAAGRRREVTRGPRRPDLLAALPGETEQ